MKKILVAVVLLGGVTAVAFASFNNKSKKGTTTEKRSDCDKMEKKQCGHSCPFS